MKAYSYFAKTSSSESQPWSDVIWPLATRNAQKSGVGSDVVIQADMMEELN